MVILEKNKNKFIGDFGEKIALKYLQEENYIIIDKNFICHYGEIDIIALKENEYVFCEVKTRRNVNYGSPAESVNYYKKRHIWNCAKYYLYKNRSLNCKVRFDVIEIYINKNKINLNHIKNVM